MKQHYILISCLLLSLGACDDQPNQETVSKMTKNITAPVAKKVPYEMEIHDHKRVDDYYWMRDDDRTDPKMLAHLEAENDYLKTKMKHTEDFQTKLYDEIVGRIKKDDSSVPVLKNGYWYQVKYDGKNEYPVHARWKDGSEAEVLLFDENIMAKGHEYFSLNSIAYSQDNMLAAFGTDTLSRRLYTIEIKNLGSDAILQDKLVNTSGRAVWANDNEHVFYIKKDPDTLLGLEVYRHKLGTEQNEDVLVFQEEDTSFSLGLSKSRDDSVIYIHQSSTDVSGVLILDADKPFDDFEPFLPLEKDHKYAVEKLGNDYYIHTNWNAQNFRIMKTSKDQTADKSAWQDVIAYRDAVYVEDFTVFESSLVIKEKENGENRIRVMNLKSNESHFLKFDDPIFSVYFSNNPQVTNASIRVRYSSMTTPNTIYEFNLASGERTILKQDEVMGGFDPANYQSERIFIDARDGAKIPVSIVYRKDTYKNDGTNPIFQYGYGSYGITIEPSFNGARLSLLDRGVVYVIAHVRGSEMLGRPWYEDGRLFNKMNSFNDFIDITKALPSLNYGDKDKIYAMGGSAGGLLMGAILNMAPELYLGVGAHVPFVDVMTTMLDETIPLTTYEYDQWGNPNVKADYEYMLSYSPYDHVKAKDYPNILVTTGLYDSQVQYFEPMKWVAKLRDYKTDDNLLVFETDMEAGHGGASGRFKRYKQSALEYAFLFDLLGIKE